MSAQSRAYAVHLLTASGAVFAMLAMLAAVRAEWSMMFLWLVVAFAVDGVDGPLARHFDVRANAPQIDGVLLDLIVDYLTYVFIPAYALFASGLLPGWTGWAVIIIITFASALYFADTRMKTADKSFSGFPACWNMVAIVIFALQPTFWMTLGIVVVLAAAMFTRLKFIHPVRTARWRAVTLPVALIWTVCAGWTAWIDFRPAPVADLGLVLTSLYLCLAGIVQEALPRRPDQRG
ncbi:MAG: CDP-alcohol phosphatidyltransferase family protein [Gemmobacter sp.]